MLKISLLSIDLHKLWVSNPEFCIFGLKFFPEEKDFLAIFRQSKLKRTATSYLPPICLLSLNPIGYDATGPYLYGSGR